MPKPNRPSRGRIALRDLAIVQAVAEHGSMAKTAVAMGMSQPAISQSIASLEATLGVPLFDRSSQGVTPTQFGMALIARSVVVFNELRDGVDEIAALANPGTGTLRIGTTPPMSAVAAAVIDRLVRRYPSAKFHLIAEPTPALLLELQRRSIELVISRMIEPPEAAVFAADLLFEDELAVIAHRSSPWARHKRITLADLWAERWALPPPEGYLSRIIARAFQAEGLAPPTATVTTPSSHALGMLVMARAFLTVHPTMMLRFPERHPMLVALPVDMRVTRNPVGLIRLKGRALSPIASLFIETAKLVARTIPGSPAGRGRGGVR